MSLTTAQQVRLKISDPPKYSDQTFEFDGATSSYTLPHVNIANASAYVLNGGAWSATAATFNASGMVSFATAYASASAFRATYEYSTFSDDEIDHFITVGGDVIGAAIEACESLMFDSLRRLRWRAFDGTEVDDTKAQQMLGKIYDVLKKEQEVNSIVAGNIDSWAINQELY